MDKITLLEELLMRIEDQIKSAAYIVMLYDYNKGKYIQAYLDEEIKNMFSTEVNKLKNLLNSIHICELEDYECNEETCDKVKDYKQMIRDDNNDYNRSR